MSKQKLNAFMPYTLGSAALYDWCGKAANSKRTLDVLEPFMAKDPHATEWSSMGLVCPIEDGTPVHDLDGTARMLTFQFNERILPGSVRDEKLREEIKRISEKEDRELNKREYAQIKEDVEFKLLPKAFIRRALVPVMVFPAHLLIFTTSAKKAEDIVARLATMALARKVEFDLTTLVAELELSIGDWLGRMARGGESDGNDDTSYIFYTKNAAVFKGSDKRAIRIKDRDIASKEVHDILNQPGYGVTELLMGLNDFSTDQAVLTFTFTDRFVFKGIKLSDVTMAALEGNAIDKHANAWLAAKTYKLLLDQVVLCLNDANATDYEL